MDRHLLPMAGAIWSAAPGDMRDYPAKAFLRFFDNHGLLKVKNRPAWRTVKGGSREYVARLIRNGTFETRLRTPIASIGAAPPASRCRPATARSGAIDDVVLACHADHALAMLSDATAEERQMPLSFRYRRTAPSCTAIPADADGASGCGRAGTISSRPRSPDCRQLCVTYWMNSLQPLRRRRRPVRHPQSRSASRTPKGRCRVRLPPPGLRCRRNGRATRSVDASRACGAPGSAAAISATASMRTACRRASRSPSSWVACAGRGPSPMSRAAFTGPASAAPEAELRMSHARNGLYHGNGGAQRRVRPVRHESALPVFDPVRHATDRRSWTGACGCSRATASTCSAFMTATTA